jgi:Leucine-rich repeat (LRR) protein
MTRALLLLSILSLLSATSCQTYKRSFGTTYTSYDEAQNKTIYRLDLSHQSLTEAPRYIDQCEDLKMLNLSGNTAIDLELFLNKIPNPEALEVLILDSLELKKTPSSLKRFIHLKHLSLNGNLELDLEQLFKALVSLPVTFIDLQNNSIQTLPQELQEVKSLRSINLSGNRLASAINYTILGNLPRLESLWITNNGLSQLPTEIGQLSSLRNLYMEHNALKSLPTTLADLKKVWILHAAHNDFKELPAIFTKMPSLLLLHINNNKISSIPEQYALEKYALMGIIIDNNNLSDSEIKRWEKEFKKFFQASF